MTDFKDLASRALWTASEAAVAVVVAAGADWVSLSVWEGAGIAAGAAALSAVKTWIVQRRAV